MLKSMNRKKAPHMSTSNLFSLAVQFAIKFVGMLNSVLVLEEELLKAPPWL